MAALAVLLENWQHVFSKRHRAGSERSAGNKHDSWKSRPSYDLVHRIPLLKRKYSRKEVQNSHNFFVFFVTFVTSL
jgi:hypothetical protein